MFYFSFSYSQIFGKKEKVEILYFKIDSLNKEVNRIKNEQIHNETQFKNAMSVLENKIVELNKVISDKEMEINECKNSATNLLKNANKMFVDGNYQDALTIYDEIIQIYPTSKEAEIALQKKIELNQIKKNIYENQRNIEAQRNLNIERDAFKERTFYEDKRGKEYSNIAKFNLYFSLPDNSNTPSDLRFVIGYKGEDWLFIDRITFLIRDGEKITISADFKRDYNSDFVYEWTDIEYNNSIKKVIDAIIEGKAVLIRFHGDKYKKDVMMNKSQIEGIINIHNKYIEMGGKI